MLTSCFGLPLRTGTSIISIINSIFSVCYVIYYAWEHNYNYGYNTNNELDVMVTNSFSILHRKYGDALDEVFLNYITLIFMLVGFTSMFASFGLKQATLKNATHKIYLWLLIGYVQLGTIVTIEIVVLTKHTRLFGEIVGLFVFFAIVDAILVYQLLVVQSFYGEEKLVEETNYIKLRNELTSRTQPLQDDDFQSVELEL